MGLSTEARIKKVAGEVFLNKGFSDTTTRDIAKAAEVNISTLHYYYRSKDQLFDIIAKETMDKFSGLFKRVFEGNQSLREKIFIFASEFIDFFKENPELPLFITIESQRNPDKFHNQHNFGETDNVIKSELENLIIQKIIRPISFSDFMNNLIALTIFPFLSRNSFKYSEGLSEDQVNDMLEERKKMIPEMIVSYLYINN